MFLKQRLRSASELFEKGFKMTPLRIVNYGKDKSEERSRKRSNGRKRSSWTYL
jgi:hypothetical protein